ncbi:FAD-dependent monooxygenase [uncultured Sphingomonas sp.]|uniref:FAD-dependent monooxygenase n=1 Tax=uncultured Sphingomonas sp. TaxID=158754 RepID=UPI0035C98C9A
MSEAAEHAVVVIGAGPSGLALAIELGSRGVDCLLVERNDRVGYAPRAKTTNVRTRTHLRRWGIADKLASVAPFGIDYPSDVKFVTRLGGFGLATIENASNCAPARNDFYPEHGQWVPQYKLEQVLREHAETLPSVRIVFNTAFKSADQSADGVDVVLEDVTDGTERRVSCRYLVGGDGARSAVRDLIGATMSGKYGLSRNYNIVFRAPGLARAHPHGQATMYWQVNPAAPSLIGPMDEDDLWFFMPTRLPEGFTITRENAATLIREATAIDLSYEIRSSDEWVASSLIADRYRQGGVFLIGDACHLHPPFGGYGMNMGVADGVDLGWKIAAVLQGWGGPALLDSYETERRAIHEEVIAEAAANHAVLSNDFWSEGLETPGEDGDALRAAVGKRIYAAKEREFHTLGTVLGGCYAASPIIATEPAPAAPGGGDARVYEPSSRPGCLAPHAWRADASSLYDAFGKGFALLCRPDADPADARRAVAEASAQGEPLVVVDLSVDEAADRYPCSLTLVRPDQFVAWRGNSWAEGILAFAAGWDRLAGSHPSEDRKSPTSLERQPERAS